MRAARASSQVAQHFPARASQARDAARVRRVQRHARVHARARARYPPLRACTVVPSFASRAIARACKCSARSHVDRRSVECKIEKRVTLERNTEKNVCRFVDVNFVRPRDVEMLDVPS
jgi:hypothetical protein